MITDKLDKLTDRTSPRPPETGTRVIDTADLFGGESEVIIRHEGTIYRMKITRQGKLILNK
ncbi:hemin uptake protein HemP [Rhizobium sp. LjRoot30]|uniref:hemin uptake protein HemP n=1 Tax=Rhizobium sp. LjRoot30 TaxID=3342320 RepID=UPI003ECC2022